MKEMVGGCCVCSDEHGWDENPLVYCDGSGCNVAVHQACYGIVSVPKGPWFCRKCESQERAARVRCELCPQKEGALKRTDTGGWCHVVCALYIPEAWFGNVQTMEPIILKAVPQERYNKSCYICEEQEGKANTGGCMQCNKIGCRRHFHVTCAQAKGLLCEEAGNLSDNVKYCGYCSYHYKKAIKDGSVKVIPPIRGIAAEADSQEKDGDPTERGEKPKLRIGASQGHSVQPSGLSPALTASEAESKERGHSRSSLNSSPDSSTAEANSPAVMRNTLTTTPCSAGVKNVLSKFTTANFVETTIGPSPANFGNFDSKEDKGKITTAANLMTLPENPDASVSCSNSKTFKSKASKSNNALLSDSSERKIDKNTDSALLANFGTLEGPAMFSDLSNKSSKIAEIQNGRSSPPVRTEKPATTNCPTASFSVAAAASKPTFTPTFASFFSGSSVSSQLPPAKLTSNEAFGSESSDTPTRNKRTSEHEPNGKKRIRKQRVERSVEKGKTVKDLLLLPTPGSSGSSVASQKTFSSPLSVGSGLNTGETSAKKPVEATFPKFHTSGFAEHNAEYGTGLSFSGVPKFGSVSGIDATKNGEPASNSERICPLPLLPGLHSNHVSLNSEALDSSHFPTSMEELLRRQWIQGSQFLMEQGQMLDIASLVNCLHDLRHENQRLEERINALTARRDNLVALNARLSIPFSQNNTPHSTSTPHGTTDSTSTEHQAVNRHASRSRVNNSHHGDQNLQEPNTVFVSQGNANRVGSNSTMLGLLNQSPLHSSGIQHFSSNQSRSAHSGGSHSAAGMMPPGSGLRQQSQQPRQPGVTSSLPVPANLLGSLPNAASHVDMALFAEQLQRQQFLQQNSSLEQNRQLLYQLQLLAPSSISISAPFGSSSRQSPLSNAHSLAGDLVPSTTLQQPLPTRGRVVEARGHQKKADDKG